MGCKPQAYTQAHRILHPRLDAHLGEWGCVQQSDIWVEGSIERQWYTNLNGSYLFVGGNPTSAI